MTIQRAVDIWEAADGAERDSIGSDVGARVGDICNVRGSGLFLAETVAANSSTWAAAGGGGASSPVLGRIPKDVNSVAVWDFDGSLQERDGAPGLTFNEVVGTASYWSIGGLRGIRVPNNTLALEAIDASLAIADNITVDYLGFVGGGTGTPWVLGQVFTNDILQFNLGINPAVQIGTNIGGGSGGNVNTTAWQEIPQPHLFTVTYNGGLINYYVDGVFFATGLVTAMTVVQGRFRMFNDFNGDPAGGGCIGIRLGDVDDDAATVLQRARDVGVAA